jgi:hypothetical protein
MMKHSRHGRKSRVLAAGALALALLASACSGPSNGGCIDVTTYDGDWNNDMKCKRQDGTVFYTDYSGARAFEAAN